MLQITNIKTISEKKKSNKKEPKKSVKKNFFT